MKKEKLSMPQAIEKLRAEWTAGDAVRDADLTVPQDLKRFTDIPYGSHPLQKLDVYRPAAEAAKPLPTIVSIHGGGWFYGSKELYSHYCMRLAQRGFAVVNFSYRLAPEDRYPAAVQDCCTVLQWLRDNAAQYGLDTDNLFVLGDSAGGQLCWQVCAMLTNPAYAATFDFAVPALTPRACALNCGCYFIPASRLVPPARMGAIFEAYFPQDFLPAAHQLRVGKYITGKFPPAFVMSAQNDYLKFMAAPAYRILRRKGVEAELHIYGTKEQKEIGHVFHVNCKLPLAAQCNDEECAFFRRHLR